MAGRILRRKCASCNALEEYARAFAETGDALVICGDLNVARAEIDVHPKERRAVIGQLPEERALIERILATGLVDVGRRLHPDDDAMYTWWAPWRQMKERNIGWRLDYLLASRSLAERADRLRSAARRRHQRSRARGGALYALSRSTLSTRPRRPAASRSPPAAHPRAAPPARPARARRHRSSAHW